MNSHISHASHGGIAATVRRWLVVVAVVMVGLAGSMSAVHASDDLEAVRLVPGEGGHVVIDDRSYEGPVTVRAYQGGVGVVETVTMDQYLMGIREVPFGWPTQALQTQVVAARTYATWTLSNGSSATATKYEYDICATSRCQVYKGWSDLDSELGLRWRRAVEATTNEILVYNESPAQALYSSSMGSHTLANQDVWGGKALPYLQSVSSPEVGTAPFATWTVVVPTQAFLEILRRDGFDVGSELKQVALLDTAQRMDRATVVVSTEEGDTTLSAVRLRGALNEWGARLYPSRFPVVTPKGNVYPQTMLSYSFDLELREAPLLAASFNNHIADVPANGSVVIAGEGFGHGVGMSQWGARIMADGGATYGEILGHYYGGLEPSVSDLVPAEVRVGLVAGRPNVRVEIEGPVGLEVNGLPAGSMTEGTWIVFADGSGVLRVWPPSSDPLEIFRRPWPK